MTKRQENPGAATRTRESDRYSTERSSDRVGAEYDQSDGLDDAALEDLRDYARELQIENYDALTREDLLQQIRDTRAE